MSGSNTEESILNNIPDFADGGGGDDTSTAGGSPSSGGDTGGAQTSAQPASPSGEGSSSQPPARQSGDIVRRHDGLVERQSADNPNARDLVDPISGRIVARGGVERHVYEQSMRMQRENNSLKQQIQGLQNTVRASNETLQEAARLGVQPQDQIIAIRVMAEFMRDPVRTLESLVEEVKSKGYPIPFLQQGVSQGMDLGAIGRMIDGKLAPILGQHQQTQRNQQFRQQAQRDLETFLDQNQEANQNLDVLNEMLQADPGLPLQQAYLMMIRWAGQNGLDWTAPLKPQIHARMNGGQQQTPNQQPAPEQRPLPGGRSVSPTGAAPVNGSGRQFNENASWSDIIRDAMQEHNVQLR